MLKERRRRGLRGNGGEIISHEERKEGEYKGERKEGKRRKEKWKEEEKFIFIIFILLFS